MKVFKTSVAGVLAATSLSVLAEGTSIQQRIDRLETRHAELEGRLEDLVDFIDSGDGMRPGTGAPTSESAAAHAATGVGAYGEFHARLGDDGKAIDLHRFVALFGHEFDASMRFWGEIEIEHAQVSGSQGEVSVEQAYIEQDMGSDRLLRAGLVLVPAGIVNESHEPTAFYGVERNPVERAIVPTTWREAGVMILGRAGHSVDYALAVHSGLAVDGDYSIRRGRQGASQARLEDLAYTARLRWRGEVGWTLSGTVQYQEDIGQGATPGLGEAVLATVHATWRRGEFEGRALYASWWLAGGGARAFGADRQAGWYIEPAWRPTARLGVFVRQGLWDVRPHDGVDSQATETVVGVDFQWHEGVVVKADLAWNRSGRAGRTRTIDLGLGFSF